MSECAKLCSTLDVSCPNSDCRMHINFEEDLNCTLIAIKKNGPMTLRQVADREGISFVAVKYIEEAATKKLKKGLKLHRNWRADQAAKKLTFL